MLIKKSQAIKKQIAKEGFVYEYKDYNKSLGVAVSELNGRIPDNGLMKNNVCHEVYYVLSGSAKVYVDDKSCIINEGDVLHINIGQEYYLEADNLKLVISTSPAFYPEQWENII